MYFCNKCENMYYIRLSADNDNALVYYCRNCGNEESDIDDNLTVSKTTYKKADQKYFNIINQYTKLDPTLPRVRNIPCPNNSCACNSEDSSVPREVIYIRYDDSALKFVYLCVHCDTIWKSHK